LREESESFIVIAHEQGDMSQRLRHGR
jgi:hypothetical protein